MSKPLLILVIMALFAVSVNVAYAQTPPTTPTISTVAITSSPGTDNTYTTLDVITVGLSRGRMRAPLHNFHRVP